MIAFVLAAKQWRGAALRRSPGVLATCFLAILLSGCGKSGESTRSAPGPQTVGGASNVTAIAAEPDLTEITRNLRRWIVRNQRPPKNFEDFAATANVTIPPPPEGKKYAIDKTMHVILVKR